MSERGQVSDTGFFHVDKAGVTRRLPKPAGLIAVLWAGLLAVTLACLLLGCGKTSLLDPRKPVTLTLWHTYVEDMRYSLDELIKEFNHTVGAQQGVVVKVTSVADARVLNEQIIAAANKDPGAHEMPDMAVIYPQVAITLARKGALADLGQYITPDALSSFVPEFILEGRLNSDSLYLMPIAKSAEVLYVNRTLFERFSGETGVTTESLSTFEGIKETAARYYEWSGGKSFFYPENLFNQAMIGFQQLGDELIHDRKLNLSTQTFARIWDCYYAPAVKGGVSVYDGWGNYLASTGEVVCATASSAGSSFYPSSVTWPDNTKEDVVIDVLPYPVFAGGEKVVMQRGGGICVSKSSPAREYAACLFLNWLTEAQRNLRFCANIGYVPVRRAAFDQIMAGNFPEIANPISAKALLTVAAMREEYRFYVPPVFDGLDAMQSQYAGLMRAAAQSGRVTYARLLEEDGAPAVVGNEHVSPGGLAANDGDAESDKDASIAVESESVTGEHAPISVPDTPVPLGSLSNSVPHDPALAFEALSREAMEDFIQIIGAKE